jgi:P2-related tail formation protein
VIPPEHRLTVPAGILDRTTQILVDLIEERFGSIDVSVILTYLLEHVDASVLPALGWTFDIPPVAWAAADTTGRRAIVEQALYKQRRRGVPGQVKAALLETLGLVAHIKKNPLLLCDGSWRLDGTFHCDASGRPLTFWLVLPGTDSLTSEEEAQVILIVAEWKRRSAHLMHIYFAPSEEQADDHTSYWSRTTVGLLTTEDGQLITTEDGAPFAA